MTIEFDTCKIIVPERWEDVRISEYEKWYNMPLSNNREIIEYTAAVCGIDKHTLFDLPTELYNEIFDAIQFVFKEQIKPCHKLKIGNEIFFVEKFDKITLGEYVDVDSILNSESDSKLSEILSVVCRPVGERYDADDDDKIANRIDIFKKMTCDKAIPLLSFFFLNRKESDKILSLSSKVEEMFRLLQLTSLSATNGGGIRPLSIWQGIKYYFLMRSQRKKLLKYLDT